MRQKVAPTGDGRDRRDELQALLDGGTSIDLEAGVFEIATAPPANGPHGRRPYHMLRVAGVELAGVGPLTVLHFTGDATAQDWHGIAVGTSGSVRDLTLDTSALVGTVEQTHAIHIAGPVDDPVIQRVTFEHPARGMPGGDGLQIVGYAGLEVKRARIADCEFRRCDRSGIAVHSGSRDLAITGCTFWGTGDKDIDFEGTGDIDTVLIDTCTFGLGADFQGDVAIELQAATNVRILNCTFDRRGIFVYGCQFLEIANTVINHNVPGLIAAIELAKNTTDVNVHGCTITRGALSGSAPVIRAAPHGSGTPARIVLADNVVTQLTSGHIVQTTGVLGLAMQRNKLAYGGSVLRLFSGVFANGSVGIRADQIFVTECDFRGPLLACVAVSGSYAGCAGVICRDNTALGPLHGLSSGGATGPIVATSNSWPLS